jgi:hypothetical protein
LISRRLSTSSSSPRKQLIAASHLPAAWPTR